MIHKRLEAANQDDVHQLFYSVFRDSESEAEGQLIGHLASELCAAIDDQDIIGFGCFDQQALVASIFFSRLRFSEEKNVYLLAPVAVSSEQQRKGIGQSLIRFGLEALRNQGVAVVVTYGDPNYYCRVGFKALSEKVIQPPLTLSIPEGWLGMSLLGTPIPTLLGRPKCVESLHNPAYW